MAIYRILNEELEVVNTIVADDGFMDEHYPEGNYELYTPPQIEENIEE